jgi:protease I
VGDTLQGKRIAFLATDMVEQVELTEPWKAVENEGATAELISLEEGEIPGVQPLRQGRQVQVDRMVEEARADDYDALVSPGGPDTMRTDENAVDLVRKFFKQGKPVGVICHGAVDARRVRRRARTHRHFVAELADGHSQRRRQLGGPGGGRGRRARHSRKPDDLPAFNEKIIEEFAEGIHPEQAEKAQSSAHASTTAK